MIIMSVYSLNPWFPKRTKPPLNGRSADFHENDGTGVQLYGVNKTLSRESPTYFHK